MSGCGEMCCSISPERREPRNEGGAATQGGDTRAEGGAATQGGDMRCGGAPAAGNWRDGTRAEGGAAQT